MKYSENFERDYNYFLKYKDVFNFDGESFYRKESVNVYKSDKKDDKWGDWYFYKRYNTKEYKSLFGDNYYSEGLFSRYDSELIVEPILVEDIGNGLPPKECFYLWDSEGKINPCNDIIEFKSLLKCKGSINFHIKMWAEDRAKGILPKSLFEEEIVKPLELLPWMIEAVENQKVKFYSSQYL